ncbi:CocE/NonD family hydrolase [Sphingomonas soli]|uniref:CocE/NonD family hydrolase n=1 Tax=Sphingomonas soli TaxID=266127 RepID=UPI0008357E42|nr:CocE/NonD family hydrolase [Sphingomonas soli]
MKQVCQGILGAALLGLVSPPALAQTAERPTGAGYSGTVRSSFYVPMRDGTRIAMNVYRPAIDGRAVERRLPVIFAFTPYRARYRDEKGAIVEVADSAELGLRDMTAHGYVVAVADIRGKGASFGRRRGMQDKTEAQDGHDLVEWLAAQPWSDGKIGMTGCSYLGGTVIKTATTAPPHLRAVFAGASDFDKYAFVRTGGITGQFNTRPDEPLSVDLASVPVDADGDGALLREAVAEHAGNDPMALLWNTMPFRDSVSKYTGTRFWEEASPYTYFETLKRSGIAFYYWSNWQDEPTGQVILAAVNLGGRAMIGPGSHCVPPPGVDMGQVQRHFFDRHLKGIDTGIDKEPRFRWWVQDAEGDPWRAANHYPGAGLKRQFLYPAPGKSGTIGSANDGMLAGKPARGVDSFAVDYDVATKEYFPFWPAVLDEKGLTYTSPPLAEDVTVTGYPTVGLTVSSDQASGNVFVYLEEVAPDGKAQNIAFGRLALAHRKLSPAPYDNLGLPWHSSRSADVLPVKPGTSYPLQIALSPTAKRFREGYRIRLSIRGADPRQRNIAEIRRDPPERLSVTLGKGTRVEIPAEGPIRFKAAK